MEPTTNTTNAAGGTTAPAEPSDVSKRTSARIPTRELWPSGPAVGALGFGCMGLTWAYGDDPDAEDPRAVIGAALDHGMTLLDTADAYGERNEQVVGEAIAGRRDEVFLATKGGNVARYDPDGSPMLPVPDGRPEHLRRAVDASLSRLGVERIDLYQLHRPDPQVPVEDSLGAMAEMVAQGKVAALGVSEFSVDQLERASAEAPIAVVQAELSLWSREHLATTLPWCHEHGAGFIAYSPLGRGFLTGTHRDASYAADDIRAQMPRFQREALAANQAIVDAVDHVAARHEATPAQIALAWVLARGEHVVPIPGTRRRARLDDNATAAGIALGPQDLSDLDDLPTAVGDRY